MMLWGVIGVAVAALLFIVLRLRVHGSDDATLGSVSMQWIAEHRLGQTRD